MKDDVYDFEGYATVYDVVCRDKRTILSKAFAHADKTTVPLVWRHQHDKQTNVLGHALLEARDKGVYMYGFFNKTLNGVHAKELVHNNDIKALSIFANDLVESDHKVSHGVIREVSLVLAGANPGALIENVIIHEADEFADAVVANAAVIFSEGAIHHEDPKPKPKVKTVAEILKTFNPGQRTLLSVLASNALGLEVKHDSRMGEEADDDITLNEVMATLSDEQKNAMYELIGQLLEEGEVQHSMLDLTNNEDDKNMNVFDKEGNDVTEEAFGHDAMVSILKNARDNRLSLKEAVLAHAGTYGIDDIDLFFADGNKLVGDRPEFIQRDQTWVQKFMVQVHRTPFSRIKTLHADITADTARAFGYITGALKKEEFFGLIKRVTTPTTVYKKQKLDRDDIVDINDFNVVAWLKAEMRVMLMEEVARAILVSDGRSAEDEDKINETNIRPIYNDSELYAHRIVVPLGTLIDDTIDLVTAASEHYKGSGSPTMYCTTAFVNEMLLLKDDVGHRIYKTISELSAALRVKTIVEVPVMEGAVTGTKELLAIIVNLRDYTLGQDNGGQTSFFDQFDIDYNQYKYLYETRLSGALVKAKSALVIEIETV